MIEKTPLLPLPEGMLIDQILITENGLTIAVVATHPEACCPLCCELSSSVHSHYRRVLRGVPCGGRQVQLLLTVRKFSCRDPLCERKVFAERLPAFMQPWTRMTIRYCEQIASIGLATCGKGGVRLAARLGIQTTRQTILRKDNRKNRKNRKTHNSYLSVKNSMRQGLHKRKDNRKNRKNRKTRKTHNSYLSVKNSIMRHLSKSLTTILVKKLKGFLGKNFLD